MIGRHIDLTSSVAHQMMAALEMHVPTGGSGPASSIISNPEANALQQERTKALLALHKTEMLGLAQVGDGAGDHGVVEERVRGGVAGARGVARDDDGSVEGGEPEALGQELRVGVVVPEEDERTVQPFE